MLLNKKVITCHVSQIVSTNANFNTSRFQSIDPFQINYVEETWTPEDFRVKYKDNTLQFMDENNIHSPTLSSIPSDDEQFLLSDLSAVPDNIVNDISLLDTLNTPSVDREEEQDTQRILQDSIDSEPILRRAGDPGQHLSLKRHKYNKAKKGLKR